MMLSGNHVVFWKKMKEDGEDAIMASFDTSIEANAYVKGCVDTVCAFTKGANEKKLLKEIEVKDLNKRIIT